MYYRVKVINTSTGESRLTTTSFRSKKKATEWAEAWKKSVKNSECEIVKY